MKNKKLNIGCGKDIKQDYINIDILKFEGVDKAVNLNKTPYPFKSNEFSEVYASHVLEHLEDPMAVIREIHRISKNDAKVTIKVPHLSTGWLSVFHKHVFCVFLFDSLSEEHMKNPPKFKVIKNNMRWRRHNDIKLDWLILLRLLLAGLHYIITGITNINRYTKYFFEKYAANYIGGYEEIEFVVIVRK